MVPGVKVERTWKQNRSYQSMQRSVGFFALFMLNLSDSWGNGIPASGFDEPPKYPPVIQHYTEVGAPRGHTGNLQLFGSLFFLQLSGAGSVFLIWWSTWGGWRWVGSVAVESLLETRRSDHEGHGKLLLPVGLTVVKCLWKLLWCHVEDSGL